MNRKIEVWNVQKILNMIFDNQLDYKANVQRQFIYTQEQQAQVIKSIQKGFVASALVIELESPNNYVLLDGKQRINSIIGFINRAFSVEGYYFDDKYRHDQINKDDRYRAPEIIKNEILDTDDSNSAELLKYDFPIVVYSNLSNDQRLTLFNVINTTGEKLNNWELINGRYPSGVLLDMRANYFNERSSTNSTSLDSNFINVKKFKKYFLTDKVNRGELYIKIIEKIYRMETLDYDDQPYEIIDGIKISTKNYNKLSKFIEKNNTEKFNIFAMNLISKLDVFYDLFKDIDNLGPLKEACFEISDYKIFQNNVSEFSKKKDILAFLISQYNNSDISKGNSHNEYFEKIILPQVLVLDESFRENLDKKRFYNVEDKERVFFANPKINTETNQVKCEGVMNDGVTKIGCGKWLDKNQATVDHIEPWIMGGKTNDENAQILCRKCNSAKGSRIISEILKNKRFEL
jgi:hypothetical protein